MSVSYNSVWTKPLQYVSTQPALKVEKTKKKTKELETDIEEEMFSF